MPSTRVAFRMTSALISIARSAAAHERNFHLQGVYVLQFPSNGPNRFAVNAESLRTLKRFARKLQQDSPVRWLVFLRTSSDGVFLRGHEPPALQFKSSEL